MEMKNDFIKPFRVGKKQSRAVLDGRGHEVVVFRYGLEDMAQEYCDFLNEDYSLFKLFKESVFFKKRAIGMTEIAEQECGTPYYEL